MREKIWNNVVKLTLNEALKNGHLKFEKTLIVDDRESVEAPAFINDNTFEFKINDHAVKARLSPCFQNRELSFWIVIDPEPGWLSSEPGEGWICSGYVHGWLEIEKGPYVCPTTYGDHACKLRHGWGRDIAEMNVEPLDKLYRFARY